MKNWTIFFVLIACFHFSRADEAVLVVGELIMKSDVIVLAKRRHTTHEVLHMQVIDVWRNTTDKRYESGYLLPVMNSHYGACMEPVDMSVLDTVVLFLRTWEGQLRVRRTSVLPQQKSGKIRWDWYRGTFSGTPQQWKSAIEGMQQDWYVVNDRVKPQFLCPEVPERCHGDFSKWHFKQVWKCSFNPSYDLLEVNEAMITHFIESSDPLKIPRDSIIAIPDKPATLQGDFNNMVSSIVDSFRVEFPKLLAELGIEGRCIIKVIINDSGAVTGTEVVKSVHPIIDKFVQDYLAQETYWKPASNGGRAVYSFQYVPVVLRQK